MWERLETIYDELTKIIQTYQPDRAGVEVLFFGKNVTTGITVAQARGVILLTLQQARLPIAEYKPSEIKQSLTGYGNADKRQMQEMTRMRSEEHTSELQSLAYLVCRLLLEKKKE